MAVKSLGFVSDLRQFGADLQRIVMTYGVDSFPKGSKANGFGIDESAEQLRDPLSSVMSMTVAPHSCNELITDQQAGVAVWD